MRTVCAAPAPAAQESRAARPAAATRPGDDTLWDALVAHLDSLAGVTHAWKHYGARHGWQRTEGRAARVEVRTARELAPAKKLLVLKLASLLPRP